MIVDKIRLEEHAEYCQLTARLRRETSVGEDRELWFRFPPELRPRLVAEGDPFVCAVLLPAMVEEKRLLIEGDVSNRLLKSSPQIQDIYSCWVRGAHHLQLETGRREGAPVPPARGVGSFFSGGVDSFHTLLKHQAAITHLMLIDGFDAKLLNSAAVGRQTRAYAEGVAASLGKQLLVSATNARSLFVPLVCWGDYHGAALAAVALSLRNVLETALVPATRTYTRLEPWGSHPLLDPLWSTEHTQIVHDGAEATRIEKTVDWICRSDLALQGLRVCLVPDNDYNCGRCEKCLRTMIGLYLGGALEKCPVLPHTLPLREIEQINYLYEPKLAFAYENLAKLKAKPDKTPFDLRLKLALENGMRRSQEKIDRQARKRKRLKSLKLKDRLRSLFRG